MIFVLKLGETIGESESKNPCLAFWMILIGENKAFYRMSKFYLLKSYRILMFVILIGSLIKTNKITIFRYFTPNVSTSIIVSTPPFLKGGGVEKFENVLKGGVEEFHLERGKISERGRNN